MRTEPPPSEVVASGTMPAASAAADPPLDPAGDRSRFQGLRVLPKRRLVVNPVWANAGVFDLPTTMAPAARSRATTRPSAVADGASASQSLPIVVGMPATSIRSFTRTGSPASGPLGSTRSASASASCARSATTAFSGGSWASMRLSASATSSLGCSSPVRTRSTNSALIAISPW